MIKPLLNYNKQTKTGNIRHFHQSWHKMPELHSLKAESQQWLSSQPLGLTTTSQPYGCSRRNEIHRDVLCMLRATCLSICVKIINPPINRLRYLIIVYEPVGYYLSADVSFAKQHTFIKHPCVFHISEECSRKAVM